jgi:rare lipoprotein A
LESRFFPNTLGLRYPSSVVPMISRGALLALVTKVRVLLVSMLLVGLLVLVVQIVAQADPMVATYYANKYTGKPTASGQPYDPYSLTAAHPSLPFGTKLSVSYAGKSVIVTINDRLPYESDSNLDLSWAAAQALGLTQVGTAVVDAVVVVPTQPTPSP